jgi:hypothetical protein
MDQPGSEREFAAGLFVCPTGEPGTVGLSPINWGYVCVAMSRDSVVVLRELTSGETPEVGGSRHSAQHTKTYSLLLEASGMGYGQPT